MLGDKTFPLGPRSFISFSYPSPPLSSVFVSFYNVTELKWALFELVKYNNNNNTEVSCGVAYSRLSVKSEESDAELEPFVNFIKKI